MCSWHLLLLLLCTALFWNTVATRVLFKAVRINNITAPAATETASAGNRLNCAELCSLRSDCFGFSWLQGVCGFFSFTAFQNEPWRSCSNVCDVYTINDYKRLKLVSCIQSSDHLGGVCERAIDGNTAQRYSDRSCSHTLDGVTGWWEGQLSSPAQIAYVTLYNRNDCCLSRLNKLSLLVDGVECHRVDRTSSFSVASFRCDAFGSRLRVLNLQTQSVNLCEVEIYGL